MSKEFKKITIEDLTYEQIMSYAYTTISGKNCIPNAEEIVIRINSLLDFINKEIGRLK